MSNRSQEVKKLKHHLHLQIEKNRKLRERLQKQDMAMVEYLGPLYSWAYHMLNEIAIYAVRGFESDHVHLMGAFINNAVAMGLLAERDNSGLKYEVTFEANPDWRRALIEQLRRDDECERQSKLKT